MCNQSAVASLMKQIELEAQAMNSALTGFAMTAKHDITLHRYDAIGRAYEQLIPLVGEEQAANLMVEAYSNGLESSPAGPA